MLSLLIVATLAVPMTLSGALQVINANENARTLVLALPGPFSGCTYLDPGATPTSDAILDLVRPSAFVTNANGSLAGQNGPISSAELTSLTPETVRYTIAPNQNWSDGVPFNGEDLIWWWQRAKSQASVESDGYRAISSLTLSPSGLVVTAVFSHPYADWDLLFRDLEAIGTAPGCAIGSLLTRPSLGPYLVKSATAHRIVLTMNTAWPLDTNRFGRVVIVDAQHFLTSPSAVYADYTLSVDPAQIVTLSTQPTLLSRIASSSDIEELTFAPDGNESRFLDVRRALSWSIERQSLIDQIFGAVTYSPSVAASAIYSQGQSQYPGGAGSNPVGQATTTTTNPSANGTADCVSCAIAALQELGYLRIGTEWQSRFGVPLTVRLAVGPSSLDLAVAKIVRADWTQIGIPTTLQYEPSEPAAALAAASSRVDVALFLRPTTTAPSYAARSWAGPAYRNTYPSGIRIPQVTALFDQATSIFNPVTAASTWLRLDQIVMTQYWVRPLFTTPSLAVWSSSLVTVQNSFTVSGFVDQLPTWSKAPPTKSS